MNNPLRYTDPSGDSWLSNNWIQLADILTGGTMLATGIGIGLGIISNPLLFTDQGYNVQKFLSPVAFRFDFGWGNEQQYLGCDVSYGVPQMSPASYRRQNGLGYYWGDYDNSYSGWETRSGAEWALFGGQFSYSCTFHDREGTKLDQYRDIVKLGNPFVNFEFENDASGHSIFPFPWMPDHTSSDKFLTGQAKLNFGLAELGLTLFTGDPGPNRSSRNKDTEGNYTNGDNGENPDEFRAGIFYVGFGPIQLGINSEGIRDHTQNWLHRNVTNDPTFRVLPRKPRFYWQIF
jgi:hypothetical protein